MIVRCNSMLGVDPPDAKLLGKTANVCWVTGVARLTSLRGQKPTRLLAAALLNENDGTHDARGACIAVLGFWQ